jgi:hypothetical protein
MPNQQQFLKESSSVGYRKECNKTVVFFLKVSQFLILKCEKY